MLAARARMPLLYLAVTVVLIDAFVPGAEPPVWVSLPLFVLGVALVYRLGAAGGPPVVVGPPVTGCWRAVHTPSAGVPSHGLHAYGQTYALDLTVPHDARDSLWWPLTYPPDAYPAFGRPVLAARSGTVSRTVSWQRDHRSRDSLIGVAFVLVEGALRELMGPAGLLGNHVVVAHDDGTYAVYAHLQQRSVKVAAGDRVETGQVLAACGNSGNSTEPHLHFHVQDRANFLIAAGLPVALRGIADDGQPVDLPPAGRPVSFGDSA